MVPQLVYGQVRAFVSGCTDWALLQGCPLNLTPDPTIKGSTVRALGPLTHTSFLSHMTLSLGPLAFTAIFLLLLSYSTDCILE